MIAAAVLALVVLPLATAAAIWLMRLRRPSGPLSVAVSAVMLAAALAIFLRV